MTREETLLARLKADPRSLDQVVNDAARIVLARLKRERKQARRLGASGLPSPQPSPVNGRGGANALLPFTGEGGREAAG